MIVLLVILHIVISLFLILVVLLQQGKGADLAGAFGGGGSQTAFGARGDHAPAQADDQLLRPLCHHLAHAGDPSGSPALLGHERRTLSAGNSSQEVAAFFKAQVAELVDAHV